MLISKWMYTSVRLRPDAYTIQARFYDRNHTWGCGHSRRLAPELINLPVKKGHRQLLGTEQADISAFAIQGIEVFAGELLFGDVRYNGYSNDWPRAETRETS